MMAFNLPYTFLFLIAFYAFSIVAFDINAKDNIAVYWGQNAGQSQQRLSEYCDTSSVDIVVLSFVNSFPNLGLNFANQCSDQFGDGLLHCTQIGQDIKTCQDNGVKVLLSLGGASGQYGFSSDSDGQNFAQTLWNKFGGGSDNERPFDDAKVDGFDFDIENGKNTGYTALVNKLRQLFDEDSSKTYYISAAPQCPYPDASVGDMLSHANVDFAFIQFYNNYCSLDKSFNYDTWADYAKSAPNSNIKLFVGLPASSSSAGSGYVDTNTISGSLSKFQDNSNFGGFSLWDASSAWSNTNNGENFAQQLKGLLSSSGSSGSSSSESSPSSATGQPSESSYASQPAQTSSAYAPSPNTYVASSASAGSPGSPSASPASAGSPGSASTSPVTAQIVPSTPPVVSGSSQTTAAPQAVNGQDDQANDNIQTAWVTQTHVVYVEGRDDVRPKPFVYEDGSARDSISHVFFIVPLLTLLFFI